MQLWRYGQAIEQLGERYKLVGSLGSGGVADVCLAWDVQENSERVVKVFQPEVLDVETLQHFIHESSVVANWNYPSIVRMYGEVQFELLEAQTASAVPYIVMEYLRGGNLQQRLHENQPLLLEDTVRVFSQVCRAVQYAHDRDIWHRCLNPTNIFFRQPVDGPEQIVVNDFGLIFQDVSKRQRTASSEALAYLAPEQWHGETQAASDIFALGVLLYRFCTGHLPFHEPTQQDQWTLPIRPSSVYAALPPALDAIIFTALAKSPLQRHATALTFWERVRAATRPARPSFLTSTSPDIQVRPAHPAKNANTSTVWDAGSALIVPPTFPDDPLLPARSAWATSTIDTSQFSNETLLALLLRNDKIDPSVLTDASPIDPTASISTITAEKEAMPPPLVVHINPLSLPAPTASVKKIKIFWLKNRRIAGISLILVLLFLITLSLLLIIHL